ncbi:MAG: D-alanine--D-alanine ligase, partial [Nitrosopumilaceae archaeon]
GKKILAIEKLSKSEEDFRIRTTSIVSKGTHGHTPDYATITLVSSFKTIQLGKELDAKIRNIMKKREEGMPKLDVEINIIASRHPVEEWEADKKFYEQVEKLANLLEVKIKPHTQLMSSDISNVPPELPALDGFGPIGHKYRSSSEFIVHDSMVERAVLLASLIYNCSKVN